MDCGLGKKFSIAATFFLGFGKLTLPEVSGREMDQWGKLLGFTLSSFRTGENPVLHSVPKNLSLGADAGLLMLWECSLVVGHVAVTCWRSYGLYSGFIQNVIHTSVSYLSALAACELAASAAITAALVVVVWAEPWDPHVFLSSWKPDKSFLRSVIGRRESVIFNSLFLNKKWQHVMAHRYMYVGEAREAGELCQCT